MDSIEQFDKCQAYATAVVKQVLPIHFTNDTPNADFDVRELLESMLLDLSTLPSLLAGKTESEALKKYDYQLISGDDIQLSTDWQTAVDKIDSALLNADLEETVHLDKEDISIDEYLIRSANQLLIRAWDLGKAIGVPVHFDPVIARAVYDSTTMPIKSTLEANAQGGDLHLNVLALFGRKADWQPSK